MRKMTGKFFGCHCSSVGVFIVHAELLHHSAAAGVVYVMRRGDERDAVCPQLRDHGCARFGHDALAPEFLPQTVAKVVGSVRFGVQIADGDVVRFQTDGVGVAARLTVDECIARIIELGSFVHGLEREPGQETVDLLVAVDFEECRKVARGELAQNQAFGFDGGALVNII